MTFSYHHSQGVDDMVYMWSGLSGVADCMFAEFKVEIAGVDGL